MIGDKNRIEAILSAKDEASKKMEGVARSAEDMARRVQLSGIAIAGAGIAVLSAIGGLAYKFGQHAGEIKKMAAATGLSTEEFQRMKYAVEQNEASVENLVTGMTMLRKRSVDAANGSKIAQENFVKLGVSFKNTDGSVRSTLDIMLDLADVVARYKNNPEIMATALDMLGLRGAGTELIPLLQLGRQGIIDFMTHAKGIIPEETLTKLDNFTDKIEATKRELQAIIAKGLDPILPYMNKMADHVVKIADRLSDLSPGTKTFLAHLTLISGIVMVVGGGLMFLVGTLKSVQTITEALKFSKLVDGVTRFGNAIAGMNPTLLYTLTIMAGLVATWALVGEIVSIVQSVKANKEGKEIGKELEEAYKRVRAQRGKGIKDREKEEELLKRLGEENVKVMEKIEGPKWTLENVLGNAKGAVMGLFSGTAEAAENEMKKLRDKAAAALAPGKIPMPPGITTGTGALSKEEKERIKAMEKMKDLEIETIRLTQGRTAAEIAELNMERDEFMNLYGNKKDMVDKFNVYYQAKLAEIRKSEKGELGFGRMGQFGIEGYIPALMSVQGGFTGVFKPGMSVINLTIYADDQRVGESIQRELNKHL